MAAPALRPLLLGEILDVSFGIYRSRFASLFLVAAGTQLLPMCLRIYQPGADHLLLQVVLGLIYLIVSTVAGSIGIAACTLIVSRAYLGETITPGDALRGAFPLMGRLLAISMLSALVVAIGTILLIIPGLIAFAGYILASAVAVIEAPIGATAAMGRSWQLTKGFRARTFVAVMIPCLLLIVPTIAISVFTSLFVDSPQILAQIVGAVIMVFFVPFFYVVVSVCYYDLRIRKEGFDLELLAAAVPNG